MADKNAEFETYLSEVKQIEKADSVLTSKQQIDRLNRPGSTYFNLNPFDVLQIPFDAKPEEIKKKYKRLSILVHPDKNIDNKELSQKAFDAVKKAHEILSGKEKDKCLGVVEDAKVRLENKLKEKRKKLKKEGKSTVIPEDNPHTYEIELKKETCKLFADMEVIRKEMEIREMNERKRQKLIEQEEKDKIKLKREWDKNFEESRQERVNSWQDFASTSKKKKKKIAKTFKPPKVKMEQR